MRHHRTCCSIALTAGLFLATLSLPAAAAPVPAPTTAPQRMPGKPALPAAALSAVPAQVSQLATRPGVALTPCADDPGWLCGSIRVPVDRSHPQGRSIPVHFEVFPHRDVGPGARDAIVATAGGPGIATSSERYFWQFLVDPLLDQRDLLLIDNRGTGRSAPIRCPELQDGVSGHDDYLDAVGKCGARLGDDADRYGSGDVALDIEDVRRALGYPQLSYFSTSYASVVAQAYAVRFPGRLRAVVADAGLPVNDRAHSWTWGVDHPRALARATAQSCLRAPACAAAQPDARGALADLLRAVRRRPVDGTARDALGVLRRVHVDEVHLGAIAWSGTLQGGELAAAADALRAGDRRPLLRLGAETAPGIGDAGDPAQFSFGDNAAAFCNDTDFVWSRQDPVPVRAQKYRRGLAALGPEAFAPFTPHAFTTLFTSDVCLRWPAPDRFTPAVPPGATARGVPTLLLSGDLDTNVPTETSRRLLAVFRQATLVPVAGAAHPSTSWSECARSLTHRFLRTLDAGQASCEQPAYVAPAVPAFPLTLADAEPAARLRADDSTTRDHRVATVAIRAALDAWLRSYRQPLAVATGPGLRGGTFDADYESSPERAVLALHGVQFAKDIAVSGRTSWHYADNEVTMRLAVTGPKGYRGTLQAKGRFGFGGPFEAFTVTGALGGNRVAVEVPSN